MMLLFPFPLIPVILCAFVVTVILGFTIKSIFGHKKEISLAILGMEACGKTIFLTYLRTGEIRDDYQQSHGEPYDSFDFKTEDGKIAHIKKGNDVGGSQMQFEQYYEELIKKSDRIMFFLNTFKYLNELDYRRRTNSRIAFVRKLKGNRDVYLIMAYKDKCPNIDFKAELKDKLGSDYKDIIGSDNVLFADMTNKDDVRNLCKQINLVK